MLRICCQPAVFLCAAALAYGEEIRSRQQKVATADVGACGTGGSCCTPGGLPGCVDVVCCEFICAQDPFCCEKEWDPTCAGQALQKCADACNSPKTCPAVGDCCVAHEGAGCDDEFCCSRVCNVIDSCCDTAWRSQCVAEAVKLCPQCDPQPDCPREGNCCSAHLGRGCEREACCDLVCKLDDYCCEFAWGPNCGALAQQHCPNVCTCLMFGDFDQSGTIDLSDFAALQVCFSGDYPGYVGPGCECADYDGDDDSDIFDFAHFGQ